MVKPELSASCSLRFLLYLHHRGGEAVLATRAATPPKDIRMDDMNSRITPAEAAMLMPAPYLSHLGSAERTEVLIAQARAERAAVILGAIINMFQAVGRGFSALRRRNSTADELRHMSDRALADIGVARGDIFEVAARPNPPAANDVAGTRHAA